MHLVWFAQAEYDIDRHIAYIEERNPVAAIEQNLLVEQGHWKIDRFPFSGQSRSSGWNA